MKTFFKAGLAVLALSIFTSRASAQTTKYKCMLQMTSYIGEGAYIAVSLINPQGEYEKTLYIMGHDKKWYTNLKEWNAFYTRHPSAVSAKTGASATGGDRTVTTMELETAKVNSGYKIRFETSVEDQKYHAKDVEISYSTEGFAEKAEGTGYIRYVKFSEVQPQ